MSLIQRHPWRSMLLVGWCVLLLSQPGLQELLTRYSGFTLLGVIGAVFANATGAGGGVVFVPFFHQLGMPPVSIIATSFGIQCCGMTAGAITWYRHYSGQKHTSEQLAWASLPRVLMLSVPASLTGVWLAQWGAELPVVRALGQHLSSLHIAFGIFSIVLAIAIFASVPLLARQHQVSKLTSVDAGCVVLVCLAGGMITAWLSVGVGELLAVYLIMRRFSVTMAIACAVILTAFTVWGASIYHVLQSQAINFNIVLFAGAGAVVGGILARRVVLAFKPAHLKIFFGGWVLVMGLAGLPIF